MTTGKPLLMALVAGLVLLAGCGQTTGEADTGPEGTWGSMEAGHPNITLEPDGRAHGTDGCNRMTGSWHPEGDDIIFSDMTSTLMACENVDTWFAATETATIQGELLRCFNGAGEQIGTLPRNETQGNLSG